MVLVTLLFTSFWKFSTLTLIHVVHFWLKSLGLKWSTVSLNRLGDPRVEQCWEPLSQAETDEPPCGILCLSFPRLSCDAQIPTNEQMSEWTNAWMMHKLLVTVCIYPRQSILLVWCEPVTLAWRDEWSLMNATNQPLVTEPSRNRCRNVEISTTPKESQFEET